ncbi:hypothetical protein RCL1_005709 [Eukaryota sp. TZLM3-RCL]
MDPFPDIPVPATIKARSPKTERLSFNSTSSSYCSSTPLQSTSSFCSSTKKHNFPIWASPSRMAQTFNNSHYPAQVEEVESFISSSPQPISPPESPFIPSQDSIATDRPIKYQRPESSGTRTSIPPPQPSLSSSQYTRSHPKPTSSTDFTFSPCSPFRNEKERNAIADLLRASKLAPPPVDSKPDMDYGPCYTVPQHLVSK